MVKFLSGSSYDGERVPTCTFWSETLTTNKSEDYADVTSRGVTGGSCIANAFNRVSDITCFNNGECNGEGKCLPCSFYRYEGLRLGIGHSPPLEVLRQFDGGITEEQIKSPNLAAFPPEIVNQHLADQTPLHVLIKNVQAKVAKCCRWNQGNGAPSEFFLTRIIDGPDDLELESGQRLKGIRILHDEFPDDVGIFYPVGTTVIAGFTDAPSFYLEPRTGLVKRGEGIIFAETGNNPVSVKIKQTAASATRIVIDTVNALGAVCNSLGNELAKAQQLLANAQATQHLLQIETLQAQVDAVLERQETACTNAQDAQDDAQAANDLIGQIINETSVDALEDLAQELATTIEALAVKGDAVVVAGGGGSPSILAGNLLGILRRIGRDVEQSAVRSFSKCQFFFDDNNVAEQWNNPEDGTAPCNGVRTDCDFYTGAPWQYATEERMDAGKPITAEALQELRWRSTDWARFPQPEEEFKRRFATPFIWAFKGYVEVSGEPDPEDMLLYRPQVLFARGDDDANYETMQVEKVQIADFEDFSISKSKFRVEPGSETLDVSRAPDFPTKIAAIKVPSTNRLSITHPRKEDPDSRFIYRSWSPTKNKLTMFGTSSPGATVYLVNETALRNRARYHTFLETRDYEDDLPTSLPGSPSFIGTKVRDLLDAFDKLEKEQAQSDSGAPLGFAKISTAPDGSWRATKAVDLIHQEINTIFAFVFIDANTFLFDSVDVDYRFLHAIPTQTAFDGHDFTMETSGDSDLTILTGGVTRKAEIRAGWKQITGAESLAFSYGYYGMRFRDRGLKQASGLNADNDLQTGPLIATAEEPPTVSEPASSSQITSVGYSVVKYRKSNVPIEDWYVVDDCGSIMIKIADSTANRVLPLPNMAGTIKPLSDVLVNGGKGAIVAQFAIESASLILSDGTKKLAQVYRDPDGDGLPANYVVLGPSVEVTEAFGRPDPETDSIEITYVFLQGQTCPLGDAELEPALAAGEESAEVVEENYYGDLLRTRSHSVNFSNDDGTLIVGDGSEGADAGADAPDAAPVRDLTQDYVWVFKDEEGRPIGRKYSRLLVLYFGISTINVEIFYAWEGSCSTYGLLPDQFLYIGGGNGSLGIKPRGTTNPDELNLGFRLGNAVLGAGQQCIYHPSCSDHEYLPLSGPRKEFEIIASTSTPGQELEDGRTGLKAFFKDQPITGEIVSVELPESFFTIKKGPMWYPYIACERPRYNTGNTIGPAGTDSTELINKQTSPAGFVVGVNVLQDEQAKSAAGTFGDLLPPYEEAYRGPDLSSGVILDIHPSLRACSSAYTYGNRVLDGRVSNFVGAARRRGALDVDIYEDKQWTKPMFGNLGRQFLFCEVSDQRGDYLTEEDNVGFRWMPVFPERANLGAGVALFSEELETQLYRQLSAATPLGDIGETVSETPERYTHKAVVKNSVAGGGDYPFLGFFPIFVPDAHLGKEPAERDEGPGGGTSTMWAWREQERPIKRGVGGGQILSGLLLQSPDYLLDNRGLEVRLRPDEGAYAVRFRAPTYDQETGELVDPGEIQLGSGPPRDVLVDFANRTLNVPATPESVYDLEMELGDGPFPCTDGAKVDSENFFATCSCETDVSEDTVNNESSLPARILHLEQQAPEGFFSLYASSELQTPFAAPLQRGSIEDPCCQCVYYIRGIFAALNVEYLPSTPDIDPVFDGRVVTSYTWSRVPHGDRSGAGKDGPFAGTETLADNYVDAQSGELFTGGLDDSTSILSTDNHLAAFFPSPTYALESIAEDEPITVTAVSPGELKPGAIPATDNISRGQPEPIVMDFRFDTYARIDRVTVRLFGGTGWEVPTVSLRAIDPENRTPSVKPTLRTARGLASSEIDAVSLVSQLGESNGVQFLSEGRGNQVVITLTPSYTNSAFWTRYAMEYQLVFAGRSNGSLGIAGIEIVSSAFLAGTDTTEDIEISERKYYRSSGAPAGGINPEGALTAVDSATGYWRGAQQGAVRGGNKYRAYAWGPEVEDNQGFIRSDNPKDLEELQDKEFRETAALMEMPARFVYNGYLPNDEREAVVFYGGTVPTWTNTMGGQISKVGEIFFGGDQNGTSRFGVIPKRTPWHAPGHAWTFTTEDAYEVCDSTKNQSVMVANFNFAHLHDGLAIVETADFWEELPSGLTRILRSAFGSPDPGISRGLQGLPPDEANTGQAQLLDSSQFEGIDPAVLEKAGFSRDPQGNLSLLVQGGE